MILKDYYSLIFILLLTINSGLSESQVCPTLEDLGLDLDFQSFGSCKDVEIFGDYGSLACYYATLYGDNIPWEKLNEFSLVEWFENSDVARDANKLADELAEDIEERSNRVSDREYKKEPLIPKPPPNVQSIWTQEILKNSMEYLSTSEQVIVFLNGGNITDKSSRSKCLDLDVIAELSEDKEDLDEFIYEELPVFMKFGKMQLLSNSELLSCSPKIAEEFYKRFQKSNDTISKTFVELVTKEKFVNYITELTTALETLVKSGKTVPMIQKIYENFLQKINEVDWNRIAAADYYTFLSVRSLLLRVDVAAEVEKINDIYFTIDEAMWKTMNGKWPEMTKFMDNILRQTFAKKPFWEQLGLYTQPYQMSSIIKFIKF